MAGRSLCRRGGPYSVAGQRLLFAHADLDGAMNENRRIALMAGALLLGVAGGGYLLLRPEPEPVPAEVPAARSAEASGAEVPGAEAAPAAVEPPPPSYPVPVAEAGSAALPALADSDAPFLAALGAVLDPGQLAAALVPQQLIRRLVVTVDNLPRERLAGNDRAFRRVPGSFLVKSRDGTVTASPANEARYLPALQLAQAAGGGPVARVYLAWYPLFNQAYRELGYVDRQFNDRLVQVIDHLLATPDLEGPLQLVQPKVFYQFADPELEARSVGQKMLIRMGSVNRAQAKRLLRDFRAAITGAASP